MELGNHKEEVNNLEALIFAEISEFDLGSSHGKEHLDRVLDFALQLQGKYGGDKDVITAASLLHDLGRSNKDLHGEASRLLSAELALGVLEKIHFSSEKVQSVITCILEHDQPENAPSSIESQILKDADFLSGLGAEGILRAALHTGETGEDMDSLIRRLSEKMPERIRSLYFPESRSYAQEQYLIVIMLLEYYRKRERKLPEIDVNHPYIAIDGISGAGKSTLVENLCHYLREKLGKEVTKTKEPGQIYPKIKSLELEDMGPYTNIYPFVLDRMSMQDDLRAKLEKGVVISDRSFVSSAVYQSSEGVPPEEIFFLNKAAQEERTINEQARKSNQQENRANSSESIFTD